MSVASDRLAAAKSRMDQISREHADRRELRERRSREAREKAGASLDKQAAVAEKTIERIQEAGKRQKAAGGWGTAAATEKKSGEFRFGGEDDEPTYEAQSPGTGWAAGPQSPAAGWNPGPPAPAGRNPQAPGGWNPTPQPPGGWTPEPTATTPPAPPVTPPTPPAAPTRPAPRRPAPVDDDDDFGGQSWLT